MWEAHNPRANASARILSEDGMMESLLTAIRDAFPESRVTLWAGNGEDDPPCIWVTDLETTRMVKLSSDERLTGNALAEEVIEALHRNA